MGFETLISVGKLFVFHIIIECKWLSHECLINIIVQFHKWIQCPQIIIMDTASFFHVTENIDFSPAIIWINTDSKLVDSHLTKKKKKKVSSKTRERMNIYWAAIMVQALN